ncbi:MAG: hypothetical protein L6Q98_21570 [Anaerolineae bacterium]|nr:hypothetical protein [Anaerolineae bacterium]NUQ05508.1 hypothetical protein [Anaerolineae bacterium]
MSGAIVKLADRREAKNELAELFKRAETTNLIHYSCESFYDRTDGSSPRITSIAVRNLNNAQTVSFSIHQIAEEQQVPSSEIEANYDDLERKMLDGFFEFVHRRDTYHWIHWNMRDINYGFPAINHRYKVLGGIPIQIPEGNLHDLARLLIAIYGAKYADHPRLESVVSMNHMTNMDFLTGKQEALAFENKEYVKLHQSTLRKVDILAAIAQRENSSDLKTKARRRDIYGLSVIAWVDVIYDHWVGKLFALIGVVATLIGTILTIYTLFR